MKPKRRFFWILIFSLLAFMITSCAPTQTPASTPRPPSVAIVPTSAPTAVPATATAAPSSTSTLVPTITPIPTTTPVPLASPCRISRNNGGTCFFLSGVPADAKYVNVRITVPPQIEKQPDGKDIIIFSGSIPVVVPSEPPPSLNLVRDIITFKVTDEKETKLNNLYFDPAMTIVIKPSDGDASAAKNKNYHLNLLHHDGKAWQRVPVLVSPLFSFFGRVSGDANAAIQGLIGNFGDPDDGVGGD